MTLEFIKPEPVSLFKHPHFNEKWLQQQIMEDPSLLGLGELDLITAEKPQHKAGRLDLLLYDEQLNRRYEVELMLGKTDPSHIIRCIEYWDIERRRYPAYDHVAVLVAEDITSRFLNVMSLLAGSIPLIAIQLVALQADDKIMLHCVQVLDQTDLRSDDTQTGGGGGTRMRLTDRAYWENRVPNEILSECDKVLELAKQLTGEAYQFRYRPKVIDILPPVGDDSLVWVFPQKTQLRIGGYVDDPEAWVKRFDDAGYIANLRRGNKAVQIPCKEVDTTEELLRDFLRDALRLDVGQNDG